MSKVQFDNICTDRLILRKFRKSDAADFFGYRTKPEVMLFQGEGWRDYTMERAEQFAVRQANFEPGIPDTWFQIAVELKDTGELIGDLAIHTLQQDPKQVEIGYTINPSYQNMGYAIEAVKSLIDYIFYKMNMHRVIAVTDVRNSSSIKLLEKLGLRREGHFIKNAWYNGEYTSEFLFAVLNEEWPI